MSMEKEQNPDVSQREKGPGKILEKGKVPTLQKRRWLETTPDIAHTSHPRELVET